MMTPHIHISGLDVTYSTDLGTEVHAVRDAGLQVLRGETLGIVGESGSGKSTLARSLLGYARPGARFAKGTVRLGDTDVLRLDPAGLRAFRGGRAAMVPQNPLSSLTPHMPIGRQLAELVRLHTDLRDSAAKKRILWLMDRTGLPEPDKLLARYPHEISGGQRQRVVIAAALIGRPELIVLDEPTTALDKTVEAEVLQLVAELQKELNATLVYVSHDLNVIRAMCRKIAVMKDGKILEQGLLSRVYSRPATAYTQELIRAIPRIEPQGPKPGSRPAHTALASAGFATTSVSFSYHRPGGLFRRGPDGPPALQDITLDINAGETLGIVGESGSGKSTLAGLVAGIVSGHSGRITFDGQPLAGKAANRSKDMRRRVQMVFQDPLSSLNPAQKVNEILARPRQLYFGRSAAEARADSIALLKEVELEPDILNRSARQLSGGQQQRIAMCRALAAEPELLICDEVTSALDVTIQARVLDLLLRIQKERGLTCLFISHDLAVIGKVSHRVAVLQMGRLQEIGQRDALLNAPTTDYTRKLLQGHRHDAGAT
ncbi:ABC transporter ATP-binding protein [Phaeobacter sp. J2-8]|uniref:dipeptide ABC transporter ATP-binding protein n=1 Tax=Phaeobacter sp. J2-8 TaxID=2931394 RepID=UPI001FD5C122|nr:ABC transporter ATP-binding protein [Phaeobacter sp. J2-8]MCJ7874545.1 ABC transporter ATP-binding protein [Phaeobacter sp. J2-8]